jgi:hypothetical protein
MLLRSLLVQKGATEDALQSSLAGQFVIDTFDDAPTATVGNSLLRVRCVVRASRTACSEVRMCAFVR